MNTKEPSAQVIHFSDFEPVKVPIFRFSLLRNKDIRQLHHCSASWPLMARAHSCVSYPYFFLPKILKIPHSPYVSPFLGAECRSSLPLGAPIRYGNHNQRYLFRTKRMAMEKTFNAAEAEDRLYKAWDEAGCFKAGVLRSALIVDDIIIHMRATNI